MRRGRRNTDGGDDPGGDRGIGRIDVAFNNAGIQRPATDTADLWNHPGLDSLRTPDNNRDGNRAGDRTSRYPRGPAQAGLSDLALHVT